MEESKKVAQVAPVSPFEVFMAKSVDPPLNKKPEGKNTKPYLEKFDFLKHQVNGLNKKVTFEKNQNNPNQVAPAFPLKKPMP